MALDVGAVYVNMVSACLKYRAPQTPLNLPRSGCNDREGCEREVGPRELHGIRRVVLQELLERLLVVQQVREKEVEECEAAQECLRGRDKVGGNLREAPRANIPHSAPTLQR